MKPVPAWIVYNKDKSGEPFAKLMYAYLSLSPPITKIRRVCCLGSSLDQLKAYARLSGVPLRGERFDFNHVSKIKEIYAYKRSDVISTLYCTSEEYVRNVENFITNKYHSYYVRDLRLSIKVGDVTSNLLSALYARECRITHSQYNNNVFVTRVFDLIERDLDLRHLPEDIRNGMF